MSKQEEEEEEKGLIYLPYVLMIIFFEVLCERKLYLINKL